MKTASQSARNPYAEERAIQSESGRLMRTVYASYVTSSPCTVILETTKPPIDIDAVPRQTSILWKDLYGRCQYPEEPCRGKLKEMEDRILKNT